MLVSSQKMNSAMRLSDSTTPSMDAMNMRMKR